MEWSILISLLILGIILIITDIIFIPGTTFVGMVGFVMLILGVYFTFHFHGSKSGNIVLLASSVFIIITTIYMFKAKTWNKIALNKIIDGKVNVLDNEVLKVGCVAIAVSDLKPMGVIEFENEQFEAESEGEYISTQSTVEIIQINNNQIIVKQIKEI